MAQAASAKMPSPAAQRGCAVSLAVLIGLGAVAAWAWFFTGQNPRAEDTVEISGPIASWKEQKSAAKTAARSSEMGSVGEERYFCTRQDGAGSALSRATMTRNATHAAHSTRLVKWKMKSPRRPRKPSFRSGTSIHAAEVSPVPPGGVSASTTRLHGLLKYTSIRRAVPVNFFAASGTGPRSASFQP